MAITPDLGPEPGTGGIVSPAPTELPENLPDGSDQWERDLDEWLDSFPPHPILHEEAFEREDWYPDRWQSRKGRSFPSIRREEFWNVCTRPNDRNSLGIIVPGTERHTRFLERWFTVLSGSGLTHATWRQPVANTGDFAR